VKVPVVSVSAALAPPLLTVRIRMSSAAVVGSVIVQVVVEVVGVEVVLLTHAGDAIGAYSSQTK
jgi:hypothetical protein